MYGAPLPAFISGHANAVSFALTQFILCLPIMYMNRNFYEKGFSSLFHGSPNMDSLVAVGSMAAAVYSVIALFGMAYYAGRGDMQMVHEKTYGMRFPDASVHLLTPLNPPLSARDILSCNWLVCSLTSFFLFYNVPFCQQAYSYR